MITLKDDEAVKINLYSCLRDIALEWYTFTLIEEQKFYVKHEENIDHWIKIFLKRWKKFSFTALVIVIRERYIMNDARRRREFNEYAQIIIRAARSVEMSIYNQIYLIYNGLDLEFRRDLYTSFSATDMHSFLNEIKNKKEIWWALDARHRDGNINYVAQVDNQRNSNDFNNRSDNNGYRSYQGQYESYRSGDDVMETDDNAIEARLFYQNISSSRNQFSIFYQYRSNQYPFYQNRVYISQTQSQRSQLYNEAFQNSDGTPLQDYLNKGQALGQSFYQANQFVQSLSNQRF